jgi:amino acid adenylation domain-containing protein
MTPQVSEVNDLEVEQLIVWLAEKGVQLWTDGDQLRVRAPKGVLTGELPNLLARHKQALLRKLQDHTFEAVDASLPRLTPRIEERFKPFSLNDIQQAYWVGRTGGVELGNVTTHAYMEFDGSAVDIDRQSAALQKLIARQDMLRAIILPTGEQRIQRDVPPYQIQVTDLRAKPAAEVAAGLEAVRVEMSHQVLALDRWPLFDIRVTLLPGNRVRTHVSVELIIMDFGSLHVFMKEWEHFYEYPDEPLPPLEISFQDFILAEQQMQDTELFKRSERYWLDRLEALPPRPQLPLAINAATIEKPRFTRRHFVLEEEKWGQLKEFARHAELTPSGLLLAAFAEVLAFWSLSPQLTINLTQYNRLPLHPQVNQLIGNSISVVLLAVDNCAATTFVERAQRLQQQLWQDLNHTHVSGVRVLRELARKQGHTLSALMPVVFTSILGLEGLGKGLKRTAFGEMVYTISQTPQVWLDHQVLEQEGALSTSWDAVEALFPENLLDDMFEAYRQLLERLATSDAPWHAKRMLTLPPRQLAIRTAANATDTVMPEGMLHTTLAAHARIAGDNPAVIAPGRTITYRELFETSNRLARWLRQAGARPNVPVGVVMEKGWEQIVAVLGVLSSGAPYLPVDPSVPKERLRFLLERSEVGIVLTNSHLDAILECPVGVKRLAVDTYDFSGFDGSAVEAVQSPDDLAYVLFTSGSTGNPKGVMLDHRGPLNTIRFFNTRFNVGREDRALALSALNFDLSVYDVFGMLAAGGALVIPDPGHIKDPAHWTDLMAEHRVTVWNSVPTLMRMMMEYLSLAPERVPSGLRLVVMSGDWIPVNLPDRIKALWSGIQVIGAGGPTETSVWNVYYPIETVDPALASILYGRPIANNRYHVMDEQLRHRPEWVAGELMAEGVGLARGYWRDSDATDAKFVADPDSGNRLYKTGDLGRYLPDGNLEILGRVDFQVKIDGYRIELGEIEAALREHAQVREAVVTAVGEDRERRRLVAYVVASHAAANSSESAEFKLEQRGLRRPEPHQMAVELPPREFDARRGAVYEGRKSTRSFLANPVPLRRFSHLLDCLEQMEREDWPLPKRLYPSAGSLYPVQTYIHVKANRVEGVAEGTYFYDPSTHRLVQLETGARIESNVHVEHNRPMYEQAAFSVFLIAQMDAIVPMYGKVLADRFCMLEAGYMGQALMMSAYKHEVGLCPIGALDYDAVRGAFQLNDGHVFLHSFVGGLEGPAPRSGAGRDLEQDLRSHLRERLPEYMVPSVYVFLDALPQSANNKVDRRALPDPSVALPANSTETVMPRTDIERDLSEIVREVLGLESVGVHHTFFDLGGTSVDLVKIHAKINARLGREIRVVDLFRRPTISLLAEYLTQGDNGNTLAQTEAEAAKRRDARRRRRQRQGFDAES